MFHIHTLQVPSFLEKLLLYWWREKISIIIMNRSDATTMNIVFVTLSEKCLACDW
ncbi:hypothetical protein GBAR_LOCUS11749 [Geodia barretti]|uniref:Uncharacterized protein n=1 Tax=Geodia barretti TaxID=519541 RepID=A0AA35RXI7_GEOBA|nr:hypothetical protein GBAR_LOCUS11749 [Geodia barretti]